METPSDRLVRQAAGFLLRIYRGMGDLPSCPGCCVTPQPSHGTALPAAEYGLEGVPVRQGRHAPLRKLDVGTAARLLNPKQVSPRLRRR